MGFMGGIGQFVRRINQVPLLRLSEPIRKTSTSEADYPSKTDRVRDLE